MISVTMPVAHHDAMSEHHSMTSGVCPRCNSPLRVHWLWADTAERPDAPPKNDVMFYACTAYCGVTWDEVIAAYPSREHVRNPLT